MWTLESSNFSMLTGRVWELSRICALARRFSLSDTTGSCRENCLYRHKCERPTPWHWSRPNMPMSIPNHNIRPSENESKALANQQSVQLARLTRRQIATLQHKQHQTLKVKTSKISLSEVLPLCGFFGCLLHHSASMTETKDTEYTDISVTAWPSIRF